MSSFRIPCAAVACLVISLGGLRADPAPVPPAPAPAPKWVVTPDHATGVYNPGEKVTWTVDITGDRSWASAIPYQVTKDGQVEISKGTLDVSSGPVTVSASRGDPGVLVLRLYPTGKPNGMPLAFGGAVISPDKIDLATPCPADFDTFWQGKLKELAAIPPHPVEAPVDVSALKFSDKINFSTVTLDNINGTHVYGQLARPKEGDKFPAMLMLQFAGVYPLDKNQVIAQAKLGWLVLDISAHDAPIYESKEYYDNLKNTTLKDYVFLGAEDRETSYFLRMFLGCAQAVKYLTSRPDWNGKILLVTGTSQGGFQSFATAALCPQVTEVAVDVPAGCDLTGPVAQPPRAFGWPYWMSNWGPKGRDLKKTQVTAGYYDGINFAARIHCPTLVAVGLIDDTARPTGVIAAFNGIKGPKKLLILPLSDHHGDGNAQKDYYQEFAVWRANLQQGRPLPLNASTATK